MLSQCVGEGRALFDLSLDVYQNPTKRFVRLLRGKNVEALDERKPGIDHRRELSREYDELFLTDSRAQGQTQLFCLLFYLNWVQMLGAKAGVHELDALRLHHTL